MNRYDKMEEAEKLIRKSKESLKEIEEIFIDIENDGKRLRDEKRNNFEKVESIIQ